MTLIGGYQVNDNELVLDDEIDMTDVSPWDIEWNTSLFKAQGNTFNEKEAESPRIDEGDYTEEEARVLKIIKTNVRDACNVNTIWSKRKKALNWCFIRGEKDKHGVDFHTACTALGARANVIQARLHHQLYVAGIPLREPLSFWADPLPEQYESEAIMSAWDDGLAIAKQVWRWPGIPLTQITELSGIKDPLPTLEKLGKDGLVAWRFGYVFLIGRSPERLLKRNFSWSKSFF